MLENLWLVIHLSKVLGYHVLGTSRLRSSKALRRTPRSVQGRDVRIERRMVK